MKTHNSRLPAILFACTVLSSQLSFSQTQPVKRPDPQKQEKVDDDRSKVPPKTDRPTERIEAQLKGRDVRLNAADVDKLILNWPKEQQEAVAMLREKYGEPSESSSSMLKWPDSGVFKYTKLMSRSVEHDFPMPHKDFLEQGIYYRVPPEKASDLAAFDGSVYFDRTKGTMSARCDKEANNLLALNLAHEVITGKRSVQEARHFFARSAREAMEGKTSEYMEKLLFEPQGEGAADKDGPVRAAGK